MSSKGSLVVVSGFSGVGKGTVVEYMRGIHPFTLSISATTRKPRPMDQEGVGSVQIADDVVAMIAALAASETDGVSNVGNTYTSELMSKVGVHDKTMGVKVDIRENIVRVSLAITIMNGFAIPDISQQVQKKVKNSVENMTGMTVKSVNVRVIDVEV